MQIYNTQGTFEATAETPCALRVRLMRRQTHTHTHTHTNTQTNTKTNTNHRLFLKKVGTNVKMSDQTPVFVVYFL